jgi:hypothetical protein
LVILAGVQTDTASSREIVTNYCGLGVAAPTSGEYVAVAESKGSALSSEDFKTAIRTELKNGK